jgi:hypothetical protein
VTFLPLLLLLNANISCVPGLQRKRLADKKRTAEEAELALCITLADDCIAAAAAQCD